MLNMNVALMTLQHDSRDSRRRETNEFQFCKSCRKNNGWAGNIRFNPPRFSPKMTLNPGSKSERGAEEYTVDQMKRWLKCRGKRDELVERGRDCIKRGDHHNLDPSIDNGKWFAAKVLNVSSDLQENGNLSSCLFIPSTGWRAFPCNNILRTSH